MTASTSNPGETKPDDFGEVSPPVLFFDGECGLCNRTVRWLVARDRQRALKFAPLQGELAAHRFPETAKENDNRSVILWDRGGLHFQSDAILRAVACVGGAWRLVRVFMIVPRAIRDTVYRFVARNRIRWFGRVESCALLSEEDRRRLLP